MSFDRNDYTILSMYPEEDLQLVHGEQITSSKKALLKNSLEEDWKQSERTFLGIQDRRGF